MPTQFELIPAIDLLDGQVVRLARGDRTKRTVYSNDPVAFARQFEAAGATRLHVVDLNGAFDGEFGNLEMIREIAASTNMTVELGGGIRSIAAAQRAWNAGVREVILGTRAVDDPGFVARLLDAEAGRVIIGIDALDGRVATRGWVDTGEVLALDLARRVANLGCRRIIYTDISTDGMLTGPNIEAVTALARHVPEVDVIASGGISCLEDVRRLLDVEVPNVAGAITGRALYDGRLDLAQAMRLIAGG